MLVSSGKPEEKLNAHIFPFVSQASTPARSRTRPAAPPPPARWTWPRARRSSALTRRPRGCWTPPPPLLQSRPPPRPPPASPPHPETGGSSLEAQSSSCAARSGARRPSSGGTGRGRRWGTRVRRRKCKIDAHFASILKYFVIRQVHVKSFVSIGISKRQIYSEL